MSFKHDATSIALAGALAVGAIPVAAFAEASEDAQNAVTQVQALILSSVNDTPAADATNNSDAEGAAEATGADESAVEEGAATQEDTQPEAEAALTNEEAGISLLSLDEPAEVSDEETATPKAGDVVGQYDYSYYNEKFVLTLNDDLTTCTMTISPLDSSQTTATVGVVKNAIQSLGKKVTKIKVSNDMTELATGAFASCSDVKEIVLPDNLPLKTGSTGTLFLNCSSLEAFTIPSNWTSLDDRIFSGCSALKSIAIPDSITSIGSQAFSSCTGLSGELDLSNTKLTKIDTYAFYLCSGITSVKLPSTLATLGMAFSGLTNLKSVEISSNLSTSSSSCFSNCSSLSSVTFNADIEAIPDSMFSGCTALETINIPSTVKSIGASAFNGATSLTTITGGENVESIGDSAFNGCKSLTSYTFSASLKTIGKSAFAGSALTGVVDLSKATGLTSIGASAFNNVATITGVKFATGLFELAIGENAFIGTGISKAADVDGLSNIANYVPSAFPVSVLADASAPYVVKDGVLLGLVNAGVTATEITIGSEVTSVAASALKGNTALQKITFTSESLSIEANAFNGCTALKTVVAKGLSAVGDSAFQGCTALEELDAAPTSVGSNAFNGCTNLKKFSFVNVKTIGSSAFYGTGLTNVTLPSSLTSVGSSAFMSCTNLENVDISAVALTELPSSMFNSCTALQNVKLSDALETISSQCFYGCTSLTGISGKGVKTISSMAFYDDKALKSADFGNLKTLGSQAFANSGLTSFVFPSSYSKSSMSKQFLNCTSLEKITINCDAIALTTSMFSGCSALKTVEGIEKITSFGSYAFQDCKSLESVKFGSGLTSISSDAFKNCTGLTSLDFSQIPDSFTFTKTSSSNASGYIFTDCTFKTSAVIGLDKALSADTYMNAFPSSFYASYPADDNGFVILNKTLYSIGDNKGEIIIPEGVTSISDSAFAGNEKVTSVVVPEGVTSLPKNCFKDCISLKTVTLPSSLTTIGQNAFAGDNLTSVEFAEGVSTIGTAAFSDAVVGEIVLPSSVTTIEDKAFTGAIIGTLVIPANVTSWNIWKLYGAKITTLEFADGFSYALKDSFFAQVNFIDTVIIPSTITSINSAAHTDVDKVKTLVFVEPSADFVFGDSAVAPTSEEAEIIIHGNGNYSAFKAMLAESVFKDVAFEETAHNLTSDPTVTDTLEDGTTVENTHTECAYCGKSWDSVVMNTPAATQEELDQAADDLADQLAEGDTVVAVANVMISDPIDGEKTAISIPVADVADGTYVNVWRLPSASDDAVAPMAIDLDDEEGDATPSTDPNAEFVGSVKVADGAVPIADAQSGTYVVATDANLNALNSAINDANALLEQTQTSTDGTDVAVGTQWATQEALDAYKAAVEEVTAVLNNPDATEDEIDAALTALEQAKADLEALSAEGTYVAPAEEQGGEAAATTATATAASATTADGSATAQTGDNAQDMAVAGGLAAMLSAFVAALALRFNKRSVKNAKHASK